MTEGRSPGVGPVIHNVDRVLDAHTHLSGSGSGESAENILECLDACGVEKVFLFAPLIDLSEPQRPRASARAIETPKASRAHG
ncbi:MAG: hypothetical protein LC714_07860 [Actinobacteria bacterium]|nr:hypothetical protein [Actinomycetota bacterium]